MVGLLFSVRTEAFEYHEHCSLSNDGFRIAIAYAQTCGLDSQTADLLSHRAQEGRCEKPGRSPEWVTSYGEWVGLVDYVLQFSDFYVHRDNAAAADQIDKGVIPEAQMKDIGRSLIQLLFASHHNQDHFQDRAHFNHWYWHGEATKLAAAGNLWSALVMNAYADHFLEDLFAPGHVRTPRRDFHDAPAVAMHDYYNRIGATYRPEETDELAMLLPTEVAGTVVGMTQHLKEPLHEYLARLEETPLLMKGDGRLSESADQRLIMTLTVARSIADILESYVAKTAINNFRTYKWMRYDSTKTLLSPLSKTAYGGFEPDDAGPTLRFNPTLGFSAGLQSFVGGSGLRSRWQLGSEFLIGGSPGRDWLESRWAPPQFGLAATYDFVKAGPLTAHSVGARIVKPVTRLDLQVSVIGRKAWYHDNDLSISESGFEWGGRFEVGYGLLFVGVGVERVLTPRGQRFEKHTAITTSLTVLPPGRFFGF